MEIVRWCNILLVAVIGGCQPPAAPASAAATAIQGGALPGFFAALDELQRGHRSRVAVWQIGDSHTANDAFSGRMRELMQARFGDGGRGLLPPGIPYAYYRPAQVSVTAAGWTIERSSGPAPAGAPFGVTGLRQRADGPASMGLSGGPGALAEVTVEALSQPGGGTLRIRTGDGGALAVSTGSATREVMLVSAPPSPAAESLDVSADGDGPVDVLAWRAERAAPGVTWSNLGTSGATADLVLRWDPAVMAQEARAMQPALILLAFGTNEGFRDSTDLALYRGQVRAVLAALHRAAPDAALGVIGPPGGVRAIGAGPGIACADRRYAVPANLPPVRAILRQAAAEAGIFFWDWAGAMGGDCAMAAWSERDPPWSAHDHVHLLQPGASATAEALFGVLMAAYDARAGTMR